MSGVEIAGLILAAPPTFNEIVRAGRDLSSRIQAVRNPQTAFGDLLVFSAQAARLRSDFAVARSLANDPAQDEETRDQLCADFEAIQRHLATGRALVDKIVGYGNLGRFWLYARRKKELETCTRDLERVTKRFLDTVDIMRKVQELPSPARLSEEVFLPTGSPASSPGSSSLGTSRTMADREAPSTVFVTEGVHIIKGHLSTRQQQTAPKIGTFVRERRPFGVFEKDRVEDDIRELARLLTKQRESPCDGILNLVGYRLEVFEAEQAFDLIFDLPNEARYVGTLRHLMQTMPTPPLDRRVDICRRLAGIVFQIHKLSLVHKNVNSGNILATKDALPCSGSQQPPAQNGGLDERIAGPHIDIFLTKWHFTRRAGIASRLVGAGNNTLERFYQHPSRQLPHLETQYTMSHDIYSLGVCILELLLWRPIVIRRLPDESQSSQAPPSPPPEQHQQLPEAELTLPTYLVRLAAELRLIDHEMTEEELDTVGVQRMRDMPPEKVRALLVVVAARDLPAAAGGKLYGLVKACLEVLEKGFGDLRIVRSNSVETGLNYMAAVQDVLDGVSL